MHKCFTLAAALAVLFSCGSADAQGAKKAQHAAPATTLADACPQGTGNANISFSGGGYHAHAAASIVMMSLMDRERADASTPVTMCDITKNVGAISSNSGGSWFLTQAAFTNKFRTALEAPSAWQTFTTKKGYFGQAYGYISSLKVDDKICDLIAFRKEDYKACMNLMQTSDSFLKFLLSSGDANWHELAKNAVFGDKFEDPSWSSLALDASNRLLNSPTRQTWSDGKALIFASSLLSDTPALNLNAGDLAINSLQAFQNGDAEPVPGAAPVMFSVPPLLTSGPSSGETYGTFLPGGETALRYGTANIKDGTFKSDDNLLTNTVAPDLSVSGTTILSAAASSSAAGGGFIDVPDMIASTKVPALALALANFAPAFTLKDQAAYRGPLTAYSHKQLSEQQAVRLADGGFVDNTSVAYMVRHLADTGQLKGGFTILAMDNFPGPRVAVEGEVGGWLPSATDVASLFGYPDPNATTRTSALFKVFKFKGIIPHVFESGAYFTQTGVKPADWCAWIEPAGVKSDSCVTIPVSAVRGGAGDPPCDLFLSYTHYQVTVQENPYFGITKDNGAGAKGDLYVFANMGANTGVVPDSDFQARCYAKMMQGVHEAVTDKQYEFGNQLAALLGLK